MNDGIVSDFYIFKYNANGHVETKLVDYLKIVTIKDSNDIITMHPYENKGQNFCIDITPELKESPKLKRVSQIDKFNRKYNRK